jgi:hypothetical protein
VDVELSAGAAASETGVPENETLGVTGESPDSPVSGVVAVVDASPEDTVDSEVAPTSTADDGGVLGFSPESVRLPALSTRPSARVELSVLVVDEEAPVSLSTDIL